MNSLPQDPRALSRFFRLLATLAAPPALAAVVAVGCAGAGDHGGPGGPGGPGPAGPGDRGPSRDCGSHPVSETNHRPCPTEEEARTTWENNPETRANLITNLAQPGGDGDGSTIPTATPTDAGADAATDGGANNAMPDFSACTTRCRAYGLARYGSVVDENGVCEVVSVTNGFYPCGRRPAGYVEPRGASSKSAAGQYLAGSAALEAASVDAFSHLADELKEHCAPSDLITLAKKSAEDERRHTRATRRLAKRFGGDYQAPTVRRRRARSLAAMARENVVEGCVREAYGALVATYQALHAKDENVRRVMKVIAAEETTHAALAFKIALWAEAQLDKKARRGIEAARRKAERELFAAANNKVDEELIEMLGLPSPEVAERLLRGLFAGSDE